MYIIVCISGATSWMTEPQADGFIVVKYDQDSLETQSLSHLSGILINCNEYLWNLNWFRICGRTKMIISEH